MSEDPAGNFSLDKQHGQIKTALIIVDMQNDFISGTLRVNGGEEIIPVINTLLCAHFDYIVYSLDWHPVRHISFIDDETQDHSTTSTGDNDADGHDYLNMKVEPFEKKWPVHCVQNTFGAELHQDLKRIPGAFELKKGTRVDTDSYSAFRDNNKIHLTALHSYLAERRVTDVYVCGLAYDICVGATALDALEFGYRTFLIEDACRGVSVQSVDAMRSRLLSEGVLVVQSLQITKLKSTIES